MQNLAPRETKTSCKAISNFMLMSNCGVLVVFIFPLSSNMRHWSLVRNEIILIGFSFLLVIMNQTEQLKASHVSWKSCFKLIVCFNANICDMSALRSEKSSLNLASGWEKLWSLTEFQVWDAYSLVDDIAQLPARNVSSLSRTTWTKNGSLVITNLLFCGNTQIDTCNAK